MNCASGMRQRLGNREKAGASAPEYIVKRALMTRAVPMTMNHGAPWSMRSLTTSWAAPAITMNDASQPTKSFIDDSTTVTP